MKIFVFVVVLLALIGNTNAATFQLPPGAKREPCLELVLKKRLHAEQLKRHRQGDPAYSKWSEAESEREIREHETEFSKECGTNEKREISR